MVELIPKKLVNPLVKKYNDLKIQAMMFDMDIDVETLTLMPKAVDTTPIWLKKWREKRNGQDFSEYTDLDRE